MIFYFTSDTNECDKGVCQNGADCENNHGSFRCICSQGYYGSLCEMGEKFIPCHRSSPANQSASEKHTTWSEFACPPISIQKHNQDEKAHKPLRTSAMLKSQLFCLRNKLTFHMFSLCDLRFVLCSRDLDVLRAQRIIGFFILITHKSTRSDNPITWFQLAKWQTSLKTRDKRIMVPTARTAVIHFSIIFSLSIIS